MINPILVNLLILKHYDLLLFTFWYRKYTLIKAKKSSSLLVLQKIRWSVGVDKIVL